VELERDARVRALLEGSPTWHTLIHQAEVTSTQDVALDLLRSGTPPGVVVAADAQRAGRGRLGRPWHDTVRGPSGPANLAVTATVPVPAHNLGLVPLAAGLAVAAAYRAAGTDPRLKWPNDVVLEGRKAAGILVERHTVDGRALLLIGCGLDLDWRGVERHGDAAHWTSLAEVTGVEVDRPQVLVDLLGQLATLLGEVAAHPDRVLRAYRPLCATLGEVVRVERPGRAALHGEAVDLDTGGRLVVRTDVGRVVIDVGDVTHVRAR
jgi:BirA family transcriptional regulator, biotin operon repressor / biotin---[acetyl-CoA-carboxylase] ligase